MNNPVVNGLSVFVPKLMVVAAVRLNSFWGKSSWQKCLGLVCWCPTLCLSLVACTSIYPSENFLKSARLEQSWVDGIEFNHRLYRNNLSSPVVTTIPLKNRLHLYIGGDGTPWQAGRYVNADPTPRNPITLKLMAQEYNPAVFLGRPCYYGDLANTACSSDIWTFGRYSDDVVASMAKAISAELSEMQNPELVLIGYSGGGTLAVLLASRLQNVVALVTIAANLDTKKWTDIHGYLPLATSLNPTFDNASLVDVKQIHLIGDRDRNVPYAVTESYVSRHGGLVWNYPTFDHSCCWVAQWPTILQRVNAEINRPPATTTTDDYSSKLNVRNR